MRNVSQREKVKDRVTGERKKQCVCYVCIKVNSRVIQEQDNGVEFFPGSVISSERHNEVIEAIPCRLSGHNDEFVFKTVSLGILKTVVPATLRGGEKKQTGILGLLL